MEVPAEEDQDEAEPNGRSDHRPVVPDRHLRRRRRNSDLSKAAASPRLGSVTGAGAVCGHGPVLDTNWADQEFHDHLRPGPVDFSP